MRTKTSRGKLSRRLLLPVLILGSMLLTIGFGGVPAAASEVSQCTEAARSEPDAANEPEASPTSCVTLPDETDGSWDQGAQAATAETSESEEPASEENAQCEALLEESGLEELTESEASEPGATDFAEQNEKLPVNEAAAVGDMPRSAAVGANRIRATVTLKFSVVETGKPDSEQLTGSLVQLIHNDEMFMENWYVETHPVEKVLSTGSYNVGMATLPAGFAFCPNITFRVNDDLSVDIAKGSSDPDSANWIWTPLVGNTIRLEHKRGTPFRFRNIDLMKPGVELAGGSMGIELLNGVVRAWDSDASGKLFYLAPGTEGVYVEYTAPAGYVGSDPIRFKVDSNGGLLVQDANGSWFLQADNSLVMENMRKTHAGYQKYTVTLGVREYGYSGIPSLPGAVVKLQRLDPDTEDFYDIPGMQWLTGTENRVVPLFAGEYRLVALADPEGYDYYFGTGIFLILEDGEGLPPDFYILFQPLDGSYPVWWQSEKCETYLEYTRIQQPTTLKFSVVETGKPDSEQLTGAHVQLIHNDEQFMEDWKVESHPVEKELYAGTYNIGMIAVPAGFAFCPSITFRVNDDLSVVIAVSSSDPDPANWTWAPLVGDTIRLEHKRGTAFHFRNIDLMKPGVELAGGSMGLELTDGVMRVWESDAGAELFYLAPGTEGVYAEYTAPAGYVGSDPIRFKVDSNGGLLVQDANGSWFSQAGSTLVMENLRVLHAGHLKGNITLGVREYGDGGMASLPGAVVKLQRLNPDTGNYYDMPGMQWRTGTKNRVVSLFVGEYRLVALSAPEGCEYCFGTGVFRVVDGGDATPPLFYILYQPLDGSPPSWQPSDAYEAYLEYRDVGLRIAVFRTGNKASYTAGETVALAARAEGGTAPYRYQFYVIRSNGARVTLRDYAYSNIFNWVTVTPDTYQVGVNVKDAAGAVVGQKITVTVRPSAGDPLRIAVFRTGNKTSYPAGETVALAARAEGGTAPYRYQFYVIRSSGARVVLRDYAYSNIFKWVPVTPDTYRVGVNVRDAGGKTANQEKQVTVTKALEVAVFRAGYRTVYTAGETVALAARGEGGTPPYQYQFHVYRSNGTKVILKHYSGVNIFNWIPVNPDNYRVCVAIRDANGKVVTKELEIRVNPR